MADETPPYVDSRRWTGDLSSPPPFRTHAQMQASLAALPAVFAVIAAFVLLRRAAVVVWELSGAPLLISPGPSTATFFAGLAAGLIGAALARHRSAINRGAIGICACSVTAFGLHGYHYLSDGRAQPETYAASLFRRSHPDAGRLLETCAARADHRRFEQSWVAAIDDCGRRICRAPDAGG